jgi:hypothetical protein
MEFNAVLCLNTGIASIFTEHQLILGIYDSILLVMKPRKTQAPGYMWMSNLSY